MPKKEYRINTNRDVRYNEILEQLVQAGDKGLSVQFLANKLGIHRDTLRRNIKHLRNQRIVKRYGKKGNYYVSKMISSNKFAEGLTFHKNFLYQTLGKDNIILFHEFMTFNNSEEIDVNMQESKNNVNNIEENVDDGKGEYFNAEDYYLKYFKPCFNKHSEVEKKLFEFINQIGAYVVYILLQTIENKNGIGPLEKDEKEWLDGAWNRLSTQTCDIFIKKFFNMEPNEQQLKFIDNYIIENKLKKDTFIVKKIMLLKGLFDIYPFLYYKMDELKSEMQEEVKGFDKDKIWKNLYKNLEKR